MRHNSRLVIATALLLMALAAPACADQLKAQQVNRDLEGWMIGEFILVDQHRTTFTQEQLRGRWTFLLLGDSRCDESCTAALSALSAMFRRIASTRVVGLTQVLFVSLDPERGSTDKLGAYLAAFDSRFIGASGSRENLARLVEDLSPPGAPPGAEGRAGSMWLIGPDGIVRGEFLPPYDVLQLTARFLKTRIGR
jgi:protein SCO1/2